VGQRFVILHAIQKKRQKLRERDIAIAEQRYEEIKRRVTMKTHRQYINEQIKKEPKIAEALARAEQEVGIAVELAKLRERRGLSQTELAKLTGMKQPQIARLESGAHSPAFPTLQKLLGVLGGKLELTADACHLVPTRPKVASARR
jgi:ribosome-binding protein aMBF1 (putative translation factor)